MNRYLVVLIMMVLPALCLWAQSPAGQIFGTARDSSGLIVPDLQIVVVSELTGQRTDSHFFKPSACLHGLSANRSLELSIIP